MMILCIDFNINKVKIKLATDRVLWLQAIDRRRRRWFVVSLHKETVPEQISVIWTRRWILATIFNWFDQSIDRRWEISRRLRSIALAKVHYGGICNYPSFVPRVNKRLEEYDHAGRDQSMDMFDADEDTA